MKIVLLSILTALAPVALNAQCAPPDGEIDIPDGASATLEGALIVKLAASGWTLSVMVPMLEA